MQVPDAAVSVVDATINFVYSFQPLAEKTLVLGTSPSFASCGLWCGHDTSFLIRLRLVRFVVFLEL